MNDLTGKIALVTGASRGVGAEVSRQLAQNGADVIINYRNKAARAAAVAQEVRALGRAAHLAPGDMTCAADVQNILEVACAAGRLDLLILNASGGLEKNVAPDYAMQLNLTAQNNLVSAALPLMPRGARVVFVTSHLAHFHHQNPVEGMYAPVAASKRAGEDALRARTGELNRLGIQLVVVSGDLIEGTITPKLMERQHRGLIEARRAQAGTLPNVADFARAIVGAARDDWPDGATIFVGQVNRINSAE